MDTRERQTVSVLELDPGGSGRTNYGVGYGQLVLLCPDNGATSPEVPSLGRFEFLFDTLWWRNELSKLGEITVKVIDYLPDGKRDEIKWWGEVVQLHLDGTVSIELPNGDQRRVDIRNCQLLNDPGGEVQDDGFGPLEGDDVEYVDEEGNEIIMGSEASWETLDKRPSEYADAGAQSGEEGMEMDLVDSEDEQDRIEIEEVEPVVSDPEPRDARSTELPEAGPSSPPKGHFPAKPSHQDDDSWQQFEVLEEAPQDHRFIREPRLDAASKTYHSRLQKEHRTLMSSLPGEQFTIMNEDSMLIETENILVRTYEDRSDLMRCLVIGPEGTP